MSEYKALLPSDEELKKQNTLFENFINKFSNFNETEEDGYDFETLIDISVEVDKELELEMQEWPEAVEDTTIFEGEQEITQELKLCKKKENKYEVLSKVFGKDFIDNLKLAYLNRCNEAEKLNFTFWKNSKTNVTLNENSIKTNDFEVSSRQYERSTEENFVGNTKSQMSDKNYSHLVQCKDLNHSHPVNPFLLRRCFTNLTLNSTVPIHEQFCNLRIREFVLDYSSIQNDVTKFLFPNQSQILHPFRALEYPEMSLPHQSLTNFQKKEIQEYKTTEKKCEKGDNQLNQNVLSSKKEPKASNKKGSQKTQDKKASVSNTKKDSQNNVKEEKVNKIKQIDYFDPTQKVKPTISYSDCVKLHLEDQTEKKNQKPIKDSEQKKTYNKKSKENVTKPGKLVKSKIQKETKENPFKNDNINIPDRENYNKFEQNEPVRLDVNKKKDNNKFTTNENKHVDRQNVNLNENTEKSKEKELTKQKKSKKKQGKERENLLNKISETEADIKITPQEDKCDTSLDDYDFFKEAYRKQLEKKNERENLKQLKH